MSKIINTVKAQVLYYTTALVKKVYDYSREVYLSRLTAELYQSEERVSNAYLKQNEAVSNALKAVENAQAALAAIRKDGSAEAERINRDEGERQDRISLEIARVNGSNA